MDDYAFYRPKNRVKIINWPAVFAYIVALGMSGVFWWAVGKGLGIL